MFSIDQTHRDAELKLRPRHEHATTSAYRSLLRHHPMRHDDDATSANSIAQQWQRACDMTASSTQPRLAQTRQGSTESQEWLGVTA